MEAAWPAAAAVVGLDLEAPPFALGGPLLFAARNLRGDWLGDELVLPIPLAGRRVDRLSPGVLWMPEGGVVISGPGL